MQEQALDNFRVSSGWKVGADGSVALITLGAGEIVDSNSVKDPIVADSIRFIRDHIRESIQINDVLRAVPISRRSLYDKFKKKHGCQCSSVHKKETD